MAQAKVRRKAPPPPPPARGEPTYKLYNGDCLDVVPTLGLFDMVFIDPPDGIDYDYDEYDDDREAAEYLGWLERVIERMVSVAPIVWVSFNARWIIDMGLISDRFRKEGLLVRPCMQIYTFGQQTKMDLKGCQRPLYRFMRPGTRLYPEQALEPSWRLENGDPRASPKGCVPGDVFDFARVTGNSKQRRKWHNTQLNEALVKRCILHSTPPGGRVLDGFGGTGTTLRVAKETGRSCTLVELSKGYCGKIAEEHQLEISKWK